MSLGIPAYPLQWPAGRPRTHSYRRTRSKFDTTFAVSRDELFRELKRLGARSVVLSTNIELRQDGLPYANRRQPDDVGVAVYFMHKNRQVCFACDRWDRIEDNIRAVCKTVEAIRGIERWGTGDMVEAAFTGFAALPPNPHKRPWQDVLGVSSFATTERVRDAYRQLVMQHHPDRGGDTAKMAEINAAWDEFCKARNV